MYLKVSLFFPSSSDKSLIFFSILVHEFLLWEDSM